MRLQAPRPATILLVILSLVAGAHAQTPRAEVNAPPAASESLLKQDAATRDSQGWRLKLTLRGHTGAVYAAAFFPDDTRLLTAGVGGYVNVWDLRTGKLLSKLTVSENTVSGVAVSPDGRFIAACADDDEVPVVKIWDARTLKLLRALKGHTNGIYDIAFSPRGHLLASGGRDKMIMLWDAATGRLLRTFKGHEDSVTSLIFTHDGARLASAGAGGDKTVRLWDARTGKLLQTFESHDDWVTSVAVSPDGETLASASRDKNIIFWDAMTGAKRLTLPQPAMIYELAFSPDGKTLADVGAAPEVGLHDALTGDPVGTLGGYDGELSDVKYSSSGALLVTAGYDSTVKIWEQTRMRAETKVKAPHDRRRR